MSKRTDQLREENNRREKSLGAESNAVLTDIVVYLRTSRLGGYDQELVRRDIAQMLLEGEKRGQTAREVIGGDYKKFCDDIISEFPQQAVSVRALSALRTFFLCAAVLLTIKAASGALSGLLSGGRWYHLTITLGDVLGFGLVLLAASAIFVFISKKSFDSAALGSWKSSSVLFAVVFVIICVYVFVRSPLFEMHLALFALLPILSYAAYKLIDARID